MNANNNANTRPFSLCPAWEGQVCPNRTGAEFWRDIVHLGLAMGSASPGKALALLCEDRYLFACAWLGALAQGFRVVLPWSTQTEAIREIRKEVSLVLHDRDELRGWDLRKLVQGAKAIDPGDPVAARFRDRLAAIDPSTVLAVIYTSGTTGEARPYPKNAMQLLGEARLLAKEFGIQPSDRLLSTVPSHHIYGLLFGILLPLSAGASFVPRAGFYPEAIAELQRSVQASVLVSVPAHLRALALSPSLTLSPPFRLIFSSGAPLPFEIAKALVKRFGSEIVEVLGSTETGGIAYRRYATPLGDEAPPFSPFPGVRVGVSPDGKLCLDSPFLDEHSPRPFVSADQIEILPDGRFFHLGRADNVLKIGGTRISVAEIEKRILSIPGVSDAYVDAIPTDGPRQYLIRALVAAQNPDGSPLSPQAIRQALSAWLEPVMLPRRIIVLKSLPRESTGKIRRETVEALFQTKNQKED